MPISGHRRTNSNVKMCRSPCVLDGRRPGGSRTLAPRGGTSPSQGRRRTRLRCDFARRAGELLRGCRRAVRVLARNGGNAPRPATACCRRCSARVRRSREPEQTKPVGKASSHTIRGFQKSTYNALGPARRIIQSKNQSGMYRNGQTEPHAEPGRGAVAACGSTAFSGARGDFLRARSS